MGFIAGDVRGQGTLFPVSLEELIPEDHFCRVIDAFVDRLNLQELGFVRWEAAETGRPGYDPGDLLKLYLYGYLQQIRSSRRLEKRVSPECGVDVVVGSTLSRSQKGAGPALIFLLSSKKTAAPAFAVFESWAPRTPT